MLQIKEKYISNAKKMKINSTELEVMNLGDRLRSAIKSTAHSYEDAQFYIAHKLGVSKPTIQRRF